MSTDCLFASRHNSFWSNVCADSKQPIMMKIKPESGDAGVFLLPLRLLS